MSVEIRYTFVAYKVTEPAIKHQIKTLNDIVNIAESLYGDTRDERLCLVIDPRFFTGYPKKALQKASEAILNLLDVAKSVESEVLLVVRRTLSDEISAKAGMLETEEEYMGARSIQTLRPHVRITRKPVSFINEAVMKRATDFTYVVNGTPTTLPAMGVDINPLLVCPCTALLGDLHPMEASDVQDLTESRVYRFKDALKRIWTVQAPKSPVSYNDALQFIHDTPLLKRHLDFFYDSTTEPVKPSNEVLNMLLPWGLYVAE